MGNELEVSQSKFVSVDFPGFSVILCSFGASIYSIQVDGHEMLSTFKSKEEWLKDSGYHGKTVGRVAGRIPYAAIEVGDKVYQLEANERTTCLHGGFRGLTYRNFESTVYQYINHYEVNFKYHSPHMECGFPGDVDFEIIYRIFRNKTIEIFHKAKSKTLTPINLTQHLYFNMGEKDLYNIYMELQASKRYLLDDDLIKQKLVDVKGTSYDFRKGKLVMEDAFKADVKGPNKNGFDDIWYLGTTNKNYYCTVLESPRYRAEFSTDYDAVVIYMNGYPSHKMLTSGITEEQYSAITMEFTNGDIQYVSAGKPYNKYTKIQFKEIIDGKHD
ncbi:MAG: hypothetical protein MJ248_00780 [Bacilli bacterium]|nr:hypothetical protein [Bacilli bacterium]